MITLNPRAESITLIADRLAHGRVRAEISQLSYRPIKTNGTGLFLGTFFSDVQPNHTGIVPKEVHHATGRVIPSNIGAQSIFVPGRGIISVRTESSLCAPFLW